MVFVPTMLRFNANNLLKSQVCSNHRTRTGLSCRLTWVNENTDTIAANDFELLTKMGPLPLSPPQLKLSVKPLTWLPGRPRSPSGPGGPWGPWEQDNNFIKKAEQCDLLNMIKYAFLRVIYTTFKTYHKQ